MASTFKPAHPETISIVSEGITGQDGLGNDTHGTVEIPIPGCAVYPRTSTESNDGRSQVVEGLTVLAPWGTTIDPHAMIRARGKDWEVIGVPGEWRSAITGNTGAVEISLSRTTG